ncbi:MAG: efflux RND transporter periplasmic adaptor subunit [Pirellulaceae bacterium]
MLHPAEQSQTFTKSRRSALGGLVRWVVALALLIGVGYAVYLWVAGQIGISETTSEGLTYTVVKRNVFDSVVERGTLESQNTVRGVCELRGWENKIIFIVPEGSFVKTGDTVVRFDSTNIDKLVAEKESKLIEAEGKLEQAKQALEVQNNKNESDIAVAELELKLAELDLLKYRDGDYIADKADKQRNIKEGEAELEKFTEELANLRALVRKGFRSPDQLRELESRVSSWESRVERDRQQFRVLTEFDHQRKITEYDAKAKESHRKLNRAKTTATAETKKAESQIAAAQSEVVLVKREMEEFAEQKNNCEIKATQEGTVAYANREWFDDNDRIREGATVRNQQEVFFLPDMSKMQVKVNLHESVVNKIKSGMRASIRVDSDPDMPFQGKVNFVAELATSSFSSAKNYEVIVLVDAIPPGLKIKPGMTAQVEISIGIYDDMLAIPIGAVTEHFEKSYIYVREGIGAISRRSVTIGRTTHSYVEVVEGLKLGEVVMLDAYQRGLEDFGDAERSVDSFGKSKTEPAANGAQDDATPSATDSPPTTAPTTSEPVLDSDGLDTGGLGSSEVKE